MSCKQTNRLEYKNEEQESAKILFDRSQIEAGTRINKVMIAVESMRRTEDLKLLVMNKWGMKVFDAKKLDKQVFFDTDQLVFEESGDVELILTARGSVLDKHMIRVSPLAGDKLIESYLGPKTIAVGGMEKSMLTNVTIDKYGNPVEDSTAVRYRLRYPGTLLNLQQVAITDHLVSFIQLASKEEAGKIIIGANSKNASGREQEVKVIAGPPKDIEIELVEWFPYADSRQMVWIRTEVMRDEFENVVADGTEVKFIIKDQSSAYSEYKSFTVGGVANVYIENPPKATSWNVFAKTHGEMLSNSLLLNFESNIESIAFDYDRRNHKIVVGPIISGLGQHVNDGTEVSLTISKGDKKLKYEMESQDGHCEVKLKGRKFAHGTYALALEVGGKKSTKNLVLK